MSPFKIALVLILAGVADLSLTLLGLSRGLMESNPHFLSFPFVATILLVLWSFIAPHFKSAPANLKKLLTAWIVCLAFAPAVWNSYLILMVT